MTHDDTPAGRTGATPRRRAAEERLRAALARFDALPDSALVEMAVARAVLACAPATLYRRIAAGEFTVVKVGSGSRIRVAELRGALGVAR